MIPKSVFPLLSWFGLRLKHYEVLALKEDYEQGYQIPGVKQKMAKVLYNHRGIEFLLEKKKKGLQDQGISLCHIFSKAYPEALLQLHYPPLCFHYQGDWELLCGNILGVVGSRRMHQYSKDWLELEFLKFLQNRASHWVTMSGGAQGVDQMVHKLSLLGGQRTIAVLPTGLGSLYPQGFKSLCHQIIQHKGLVLSPFAWDQPVAKWQFHMRNEILATLSKSLLIIQAARKSGTMVTAKYAVDQGRSVAAIPGPAAVWGFAGNNDLLYDGGQIVRDHHDLNCYLQ